MFGQLFEERLGRQLLDVEDAALLPAGRCPQSLEHHHGAHNGRHAGGVGNRLRADFLVGLGVIANIPNDVAFLLALADTFEHNADRGFAGVVLSQR